MNKKGGERNRREETRKIGKKEYNGKVEKKMENGLPGNEERKRGGMKKRINTKHQKVDTKKDKIANKDKEGEGETKWQSK